jgi:ribonuclease VapC
MVIDASAAFAVLENDGTQRALIQAIEAADSRRMSVATFVEVSILLEARHGAEGVRDLDRFLSRAEIDLVPVDREQALLARDAFSRFGKGRHREGLNYGDCFSYALAMTLGEPLLSKGEAFVLTDAVIAALPSAERPPFSRLRAAEDSEP